MHAEAVEALVCNPSLIRCEAGVFLHFLVCSLTVKPRAHNPSDAGAIPAGPTNFQQGSQTGPARRDCFENRSCDGNRMGCKSSEGPPISSKSAWQSKSCTRLVNELTSGQIRQPTPFSSPIVQSVERLILNQKVDGANPSGASTSFTLP